MSGRIIIPVIPIAFKNVPAPYPASRYEELFFSSPPPGQPYSFKTFYEQLSNGSITVEGRVFRLGDCRLDGHVLRGRM